MVLGHWLAAIAGVAGKLGAAQVAIAVDRLGCAPRMSLEVYPKDEMNTSKQETICMQRFFLTKGRILKVLVILAAQVFFVSGVILWILHSGDPSKSWSDFATEIYVKTVSIAKQDSSGPPNFELALFGVCALVLASVARYERIIIDIKGIHYRPPVPPWLQQLYPSWSLPWTNIRHATLLASRPGYGRGMMLSLNPIDGAQTRTINVLRWADPEEDRDQPLFGTKKDLKWTRPGSEHNMERIRDRAYVSPLIVALQRHDIEVIVGEASLNYGFALEKNKYSLTGICLFFALLLYFLIDLVLESETYVEQPTIWTFLCAVLAIWIASAAWLIKGKVPIGESMVIALLLGSAAAAALYPAMLRINQLTDRAGLNSYQYQLQGQTTFTPLNVGAPRLWFPDEEYWQQFKPGSRHMFELRKGGLGFYQVNMAKVHKDMEAYYRGPRATQNQ